MVKGYLTFTCWIKNQSVFWIFECITAGPFARLLSANFSDVKFNQQKFMLDVNKSNSWTMEEVYKMNLIV